MDRELRLISVLLRSPKQEQEDFFIKQVPPDVFNDRVREIQWIYRFREKNAQYPSAKLFEQKFNIELRKIKDPLDEVLKSVIDVYTFNELSSVFEKVQDRANSGDIEGAARILKNEASKILDYSVNHKDLVVSQGGTSIARYKDLVRKLESGNYSVFDTPWPALNRLVKFFRPGETCVLAARPSIGKTWLAIYFAEHLVQKGLKVLFVSKEMSTDVVEDRFEALRHKLPYDVFREAQLSEKHLKKWYKKKSNKVLDLIITGDETIEGTSMSHVVTKIQQYHPQVVFIDGAYLLRPEGVSKNASMTERLGSISGRMKAIAKVTKTLIIPVIQMGRKAESGKSGNTRGGLSEVYNSDSWAQDADYVIIVQGARGTKTRTLSLSKGRESAIGDIGVGFQLNPYPSFPEDASAITNNLAEQEVQFKPL